MRIESYELFHVRIPFSRAFAHASHERRHGDAVLVALRGGGHVGWGEIQPRPYVTGETIESVLEDKNVPAMFVGRNVDGFDDAMKIAANVDSLGRRIAAFGGFEIALLDLVGRYTVANAGTPLGSPVVDTLPSGVIIGFDVATDALPKHCALLRFKRRTHIKVKVGLPDDVERLRVIAEKLKLPLRIDANEAWSVDEAIERLDAMAGVATIASVEQPIAAADLDGLARIRAAGHRVMADESLCSYDDAVKLVAHGAADVFNVRVGKHGGLINAARIARYGAEHGVELNLGTMVGETSVLTRATEIFATRVSGFECLDGKGQNHHLLAGDVVVDAPKPFEVDPNAPGLGVDVDDDAVASFAAS